MAYRRAVRCAVERSPAALGLLCSAAKSTRAQFTRSAGFSGT